MLLEKDRQSISSSFKLVLLAGLVFFLSCPQAPADKGAAPTEVRGSKKESSPLQLAKLYTTRRQFKEAVQLWIQLADAKPDAYAEANLGWSYLQLGEKDKALQHLKRAIRLNPRTIEGHRYLGYYLMGEGKVPEAVKEFRTSMSFDPHHKCHCAELEKLVLAKRNKRGARG